MKMSDVRIYTTHYASPLGGITIASDGAALTGLWFDGQKYFGDTLPEQYVAGELPVFDAAKNWLDIYFQGKSPDFTPPLLLDASPFRRAVWEILLTIPFGQTMTYGEIADKIAEQRALTECPPRRSEALWGIIPFPLLCPATGWWERAAA